MVAGLLRRGEGEVALVDEGDSEVEGFAGVPLILSDAVVEDELAFDRFPGGNGGIAQEGLAFHRREFRVGEKEPVVVAGVCGEAAVLFVGEGDHARDVG